MARRFEELEVWGLARELAKNVYALCRGSGISKDFGLKDQIQRAAVSVSSNIAEGFERNSNKEFINFLFIAKGSCGEVRSQLYIAYDAGYIDKRELEMYAENCISVSKMISNFIKSLRTAEVKGVRYKV